MDRPLRRLSNTANRSGLWLIVAALLGALGGQRGRKAAGQGLVSVILVSVFVNLGLKSLHRRRRPDRSHGIVSRNRRVRMPGSSSFPSGHAASAFAFASAVGAEMPILAFPLRALAAAVAYSRVHTGVHYPGDTIVGALIGETTGQLVARSVDARWRTMEHGLGSAVAVSRDDDRIPYGCGNLIPRNDRISRRGGSLIPWHRTRHARSTS